MLKNLMLVILDNLILIGGGPVIKVRLLRTWVNKERFGDSNDHD